MMRECGSNELLACEMLVFPRHVRIAVVGPLLFDFEGDMKVFGLCFELCIEVLDVIRSGCSRDVKVEVIALTNGVQAESKFNRIADARVQIIQPMLGTWK